MKEAFADFYVQYHYWDDKSDKNNLFLDNRFFMFDPLNNGLGFEPDSINVIIQDTCQFPLAPHLYWGDYVIPEVILRGCRLEIWFFVQQYSAYRQETSEYFSYPRKIELIRSVYIYDSDKNEWILRERAVPANGKIRDRIMESFELHSLVFRELQMNFTHTVRNTPQWQRDSYTDSLSTDEYLLLSPEINIPSIGLSDSYKDTLDEARELLGEDDIIEYSITSDSILIHKPIEDNGLFLRAAIGTAIYKTLSVFEPAIGLLDKSARGLESKEIFISMDACSPAYISSDINWYGQNYLAEEFPHEEKPLIDTIREYFKEHTFPQYQFRIISENAYSRFQTYFGNNKTYQWINFMERDVEKRTNFVWDVDKEKNLKLEFRPEYLLRPIPLHFFNTLHNKKISRIRKFFKPPRPTFFVSTILNGNELEITLQFEWVTIGQGTARYAIPKWNSHSTGAQFKYILNDCRWKFNSEMYQWNFQCGEKSRKEIKRLQSHGFINR